MRAVSSLRNSIRTALLDIKKIIKRSNRKAGIPKFAIKFIKALCAESLST
jgi:hypothetical protein